MRNFLSHFLPRLLQRLAFVHFVLIQNEPKDQGCTLWLTRYKLAG